MHLNNASIPSPPRVLLVANRTAATSALVEAVRARALLGPAYFHLLVPATPRGLHRLVDPEDSGWTEAEAALQLALPILSTAAMAPVSGTVGDPNPLSAIADAINLQGFEEIMISTLQRSVSRWMNLDLLGKVRALGVPLTHIEPGSVSACVIEPSVSARAVA
ncbi:MAG: hypothetical protein ACR2ND_10780 [Solirubrobacteraceae bacterium]